MPTRTISITDEAYQRLKNLKEKNDSFTDVINKVTGKRSIMELAGILSEDEGNKLERHIKDMRARSRKKMERIIDELK